MDRQVNRRLLFSHGRRQVVDGRGLTDTTWLRTKVEVELKKSTMERKADWRVLMMVESMVLRWKGRLLEELGSPEGDPLRNDLLGS